MEDQKQSGGRERSAALSRVETEAGKPDGAKRADGAKLHSCG